MAQTEKKALALPPRPLLKKAKWTFQKELKLNPKGNTVLVLQSSAKELKDLLKEHLFSDRNYKTN